MSDSKPQFVRSYLSTPQPEDTAPSDDPSGDDTAEHVYRPFSRPKKPSKSARFTFDSEIARNFDKTNVDKAREGVKEIVRDAINKAKTQSLDIREKARQSGYDEGYAEGFKTGEQAASQEFQPFLQTLQELIQQLSEYRRMMYGKVEREILEMVVGLAKKVIHRELEVREDSIRDMMRLAIEQVLHKEQMTLRIHPKDLTFAESYRPELQHLFGDIKNLRFEGDTSIERGGVIIDTNFGSVDARVEKLEEQLDKILNLAPPAPEPVESEPPPVEPTLQEPLPENAENPTEESSEDESAGPAPEPPAVE